MEGLCQVNVCIHSLSPWQIGKQVEVAVFVKIKKKAKVSISLGINDGEMCPPD